MMSRILNAYKPLARSFSSRANSNISTVSSVTTVQKTQEPIDTSISSEEDYMDLCSYKLAFGTDAGTRVFSKVKEISIKEKSYDYDDKYMTDKSIEHIVGTEDR